MRKSLFTLLFIVASTLQAQEILYTPGDSTFITGLLQKYNAAKMSGGSLMLAIAGEFTGNKYVAGTLEQGSNEPLVINTQELDCTTFVEQVVAIYATVNEGKEGFCDMCTNLQRIRYRGGIRSGYASRLHYISQWIADSAKHHIIHEIDYGPVGRTLPIDLHYMSTHPASYKQLQGNSTLVKEIAKWERAMHGIEAAYIPKQELLRTANELPVYDGDIIALTTNIKGLDVTHIGFAFWENGKLHLLHASSAEGKVIKEHKNLYEYQKNKKNQTGIRVFRGK
ncbi:MAG: DUF1460 domain-containing protein [Bacteroidaceae bacterium]|nr:DUF1460 domain-containing protein [Bacteroidaceae bacterium]